MTFHEFVEQSHSRLLTYALYQCRGDKEAAQDLVQELISDLAANRYAIDYNKAPLTYCQGLMQSIRRRERRLDLMFRGCWDIEITQEEDIPEDLQPSRTRTLDESVSFWQQWDPVQYERWEQATALMACLAEKDREFLYHWCEGWTTKELAQWKGCTVAHVHDLFRSICRRLHRAALQTGAP